MHLIIEKFHENKVMTNNPIVFILLSAENSSLYDVVDNYMYKFFLLKRRNEKLNMHKKAYRPLFHV